ncbi:MAG: orotidine 5'-phosphate decarboxylase, partial [Flavobacteriales bacterium]
VEPFTAFSDRWTVLLALTSNPGAEDFEFHGERPLFQEVLRKTQTYRNADRLMYVVGATRPALFQDIRVEVPQAFLLVPGVGAQGGSVTDVAQFGLNDRCGLLVNSSRGILYAAGSEATQAQVRQASAEAAEALATEMRSTLVHRGLL